jgi:hypothetical protein
MQIAAAPNVLVVHPSLPARNVKQFIALAKSRPGAIDYASSGNGSAQHLFAALFASMAGIKMNHVPYKGSAQATTDLIAGHIQVSVPGINNVLQHVEAGRLRALGVTSLHRSAEMPEVPTLAESGVPGYEAVLWLGIVVPAGAEPAGSAEGLCAHRHRRGRHGSGEIRRDDQKRGREVGEGREGDRGAGELGGPPRRILRHPAMYGVRTSPALGARA